MLIFICLFFPAVVSLRIYEALRREKLTLKQCVYHYCTDALLINLACLGAKTILLGSGGAPLSEGSWDMLPSAAFVYIIMALCCGVFLAVFQVLLSRHMAVAVEESRDAR